jgi:hypothetical protein
MNTPTHDFFPKKWQRYLTHSSERPQLPTIILLQLFIMVFLITYPSLHSLLLRGKTDVIFDQQYNRYPIEYLSRLRFRTTMMTVRRSKNEMSLIFKNDAPSLPRCVTMWLSFKNLLSRQEMVVNLFFALTVSIRWRHLFPTLCWSVNTKSMRYSVSFSYIDERLRAHFNRPGAYFDINLNFIIIILSTAY